MRKQGANDPVNTLTGSTGISGAVDSTFILQRDKRTENAATLFCTGRDIKTLEIPLVFSEQSFDEPYCRRIFEPTPSAPVSRAEAVRRDVMEQMAQTIASSPYVPTVIRARRVG